MNRPLRPNPAVAPPPRRVGSAGFTLVELLVALTVLMLGTLVVMPALSDFSARNRITAIEGDLMATIALARSEAARNGLPVLLVAASGGATGNAFGGGWRLVLDSNSNSVADSSETELRAHESPGVEVKVDGSSPVVFAASGYLNPVSAVTLTICRRSGSSAGLAITISPSGQADSSAITTCS
ncbi:MAG TPA: GspH/FimT family pseudopilin [Burkholderiaceae bacterium]|nr:GspH/FimT family pseudopilin [Burkholderiaceae bacterium]HMX09897.1 GspH/FimT family pseudopilin [Burkholderiaceae bacterium]HMY98781.1 GspH/FimT family pseudopilin [Burkholderiaceae bacterium]HNB43367.1 GspH/FimT family pseudopilin [Burkholderiaceae bacterium]HNG78986.1 GspH/FimT family pseudopilin [Burkholderiaceae bacterium]